MNARMPTSYSMAPAVDVSHGASVHRVCVGMTMNGGDDTCGGSGGGCAGGAGGGVRGGGGPGGGGRCGHEAGTRGGRGDGGGGDGGDGGEGGAVGSGGDHGNGGGGGGDDGGEAGPPMSTAIKPPCNGKSSIAACTEKRRAPTHAGSGMQHTWRTPMALRADTAPPPALATGGASPVSPSLTDCGTTASSSAASSASTSRTNAGGAPSSVDISPTEVWRRP